MVQVSNEGSSSEGDNSNWKIESIPSMSVIVLLLPLFLPSLILKQLYAQVGIVLNIDLRLCPRERDLICFKGRVVKQTPAF